MIKDYLTGCSVTFPPVKIRSYLSLSFALRLAKHQTISTPSPTITPFFQTISIPSAFLLTTNLGLKSHRIQEQQVCRHPTSFPAYDEYLSTSKSSISNAAANRKFLINIFVHFFVFTSVERFFNFPSKSFKRYPKSSTITILTAVRISCTGTIQRSPSLSICERDQSFQLTIYNGWTGRKSNKYNISKLQCSTQPTTTSQFVLTTIETELSSIKCQWCTARSSGRFLSRSSEKSTDGMSNERFG